MSRDTTVPHIVAYKRALALLEQLEPSCERIIIAGSIRRHKPQVGDIELVALPRRYEERNLLDELVAVHSELDAVFDRLKPAFRLNGAKLKSFVWEGMQVDLFLPASPAHWGAIAAIRTGSADFSHWLVTQRSHGGACPPGTHFEDGRVIVGAERYMCPDGMPAWRGGEAAETPEERDVFRVLGIEWIEPEQRVLGRWDGSAWLAPRPEVATC